MKPIKIVGGPKSQLGPTDGIMVDHPGDLWVSDFKNNAVTEYAPGVHGNVSPIDVIQGSNTQLNTPTGMATNSSGELYVANSFGPSVAVFAKGASGNATPIAVIAGNNTGLVEPFALAIDQSGRLLVADELVGVLVFAVGANGNVAPVQTILGFKAPSGVAADKQGHIWTVDYSGDSIDEYASNANGYATPMRSISGSLTSVNGANYLAMR